jgi:hypothetical protein
MIVFEAMFFDSDDYNVNTVVIPCESKEVAKKVMEMYFNKLLEDYNFDDDADKKRWISENVKRKNEDYIYIDGGDCGYGTFEIIEKDALTEAELKNLEVKVYTIY